LEICHQLTRVRATAAESNSLIRGNPPSGIKAWTPQFFGCHPLEAIRD
jgi:hypothetical protein